MASGKQPGFPKVLPRTVGWGLGLGFMGLRVRVWGLGLMGFRILFASCTKVCKIMAQNR